MDKINKKIYNLSYYLIEELRHIKNVIVYSKNPDSGVVSFNIKGRSSSEISDILANDYNIATRSGLHCAPMVHKHYGTLDCGMVRVSISYFNNKRDIVKIIKAIKKLSEK